MRRVNFASTWQDKTTMSQFYTRTQLLITGSSFANKTSPVYPDSAQRDVSTELCTLKDQPYKSASLTDSPFSFFVHNSNVIALKSF